MSQATAACRSPICRWMGTPASRLPIWKTCVVLRAMLPKRKLLYIADTKLDTPENLLHVAAHGGQFLCGGAFAPHVKELFLRHRRKLRPVDYHPKSQEHLPPEERDEYRAFERTDRLAGAVDGRKVRLKYRLIFVWSEAKA